MRRLKEQAETSFTKGADHSENKIENTFALVLTAHQEAQPNSLSAFLSERLLFIPAMMFRNQDLRELIYRLLANLKSAKKDFTVK